MSSGDNVLIQSLSAERDWYRRIIQLIQKNPNDFSHVMACCIIALEGPEIEDDLTVDDLDSQ